VKAGVLANPIKRRIDNQRRQVNSTLVCFLQPHKDFIILGIEDMGGKVQALEVKESATEVRIELAADVLFDFDKAVILPKAQPTLKQAAQVIREKARGAVRIEGHTDAKGSDTYNQRLSQRRAAAVQSWFIRKEGLGNVSFTTEGFGARRPVAPNKKPDGSDDPEGRQRNRRVEIIIKKAAQ
jgi:outer membrane protein OmpA-like peptidoglycan-associated protein